MSELKNPLIDYPDLPQYSEIKPESIEPAIIWLLDENRTAIAELLKQDDYTWENLMAPLEEIDDRLTKAWSPVSHMNSVVNSDALRDAYNACLPKLTDFYTEIGQNKNLFNAIKAIKDSAAFGELDQAQKKIIENNLRDFHLSGVDLPEEKQKRYAEINRKQSALASKFSENVLDATQAWVKNLTSPEALAGLPESALAAAQQAAREREQEGYIVTLDYPSYIAVMTYCENADLRRETYEAFCTRASDQGPHAGQWDNAPLIAEILELRSEQAQLLGFNNYAERSLATKMAESVDQVINFLNDLAEKSVPCAREDYAELCDFARQTDGKENLEAWDISYYSEKLRQTKYSISQEELRPYFPADKVLPGLFEIARRLYGIDIVEKNDVNVWHQDVKHFDILDQGELIASFFIDMYARANKRGGAWMDDCRVRRRRLDGVLQKPVAYLCCNFNGPVDGKPALLTHSEVVTLFHEFGHGLHHMLTQMEHREVSGINGVPWDAVELPSQFHENWCWEQEALGLISGHYETGDALPKALLDKLLAARNFQSAMGMVRQLEFALFDFRLHAEYRNEESFSVQAMLEQVRKQVAVYKAPTFNRFQNGFTHVFSGGYAAGYFSYKWAEVLSADAFSRFEEEGIFSDAAGKSFRENILGKGGSEEPMVLFKAFRGREPSIDALLRHSGLAA